MSMCLDGWLVVAQTAWQQCVRSTSSQETSDKWPLSWSIHSQVKISKTDDEQKAHQSRLPHGQRQRVWGWGGCIAEGLGGVRTSFISWNWSALMLTGAASFQKHNTVWVVNVVFYLEVWWNSRLRLCYGCYISFTMSVSYVEMETQHEHKGIIWGILRRC